MYLGNLAPVSNRATWSVTMEIINGTTNTPYDLSTATEITVQVREKGGGLKLSGTLTSGEVELVTDGTDGAFRWTFPKTSMGGLCAATYDVGITVDFTSATSQIFIGTLIVMEGIVR